MRHILRLIPHLAFLALLIVLTAVAWLVTGTPIPGSGIEGVWLYSGLAMLLFSMFYVEPYYVAPRNVMANSVAVVLVLVSVRQEFALKARPSTMWFDALWAYTAATLFVSWAAANIAIPTEGPNHWSNRAAGLLKTVAVLFGDSRILYSGVFILFLPLVSDASRSAVIVALAFWWILIIADPQKRLAQSIADIRIRRDEVAEITGVQSQRVFLARTFPKSSVSVLDAVEFAYIVDRAADRPRRGMVLSTHFLDNDRWIRILELESSPDNRKLEANAIYRIPTPKAGRTFEVISRLVGVVVERSEIGTIRFEIVPGSQSVEEGDLVEVPVGAKNVYYQIVSAVTDKEQLEAKNESGFIRVDAVQLGCWDSETGAFSRFGWLPDITAPVLKAQASLNVPEPIHPEHLLGVLPSTQIPFVIDLDKARTHHTALLGITGSGKSYIALEMIRKMIVDTKVICIDFTEEYSDKLAALTPVQLIKVDGLKELEEKLAQRSDAMQRRDGKADALQKKGQIEEKLLTYIKDFMDGNANLAIFELPDLSNTTFILEFTQMFLEAVFNYAKAQRGSRICIIVEEAHTVVPESSSLGDFGDYSSNKALVNKIGQIALQGRKYGVGFLVIAQRTANVSKTVLTQCNSIICFQAFDETSYKFLANHLGNHMTQALPRLKPFHAIAVGKAFRGNTPMIVDLTRPVPIGE